MINNPLRLVVFFCCALIVISPLSSCKKDPAAASYHGPLRFVLEASRNANLTSDVELYPYADGSLRALVPAWEESTAYTMTVNVPDDMKLLVYGREYKPSTLTFNGSEPFDVEVVDTVGNRIAYQTQLFPDAGIPVFWIETEDGLPIVSKDDYLDATLKVDPGTAYEQENRLIETEIRGRGNSTWGMPKKPYRLKFNEKQPILGFDATKNWVLLANYADKTLLRNHLTFEMGRRLMEGFTPRTRFVEVYVNGRYEGVYHLTDQIRVEGDRVAIDELEGDEVGEDVITGGYLLEVDERLDEDRWFYSAELGLPITFKSPEDPNADQYRYITSYIDEFEAIIADPQIGERLAAYEALIDVPSFVNFYLISELTKNNDTGGGISVYMHKPRNGKLTMGPLWDFDIALGNINYNGNDNPEGWWIKTTNAWYSQLFNDPKFTRAVKERWQEVLPVLRTTIMDEIDEVAFGTIHAAQQRNFQRWDILNELVWPNPAVFGSYEGEVNYLTEWLTERINWMDGEISGW